MIPKIIHQIWIGKKEIPLEYIKFSEMWKELYPEFQYILWDNDRVKKEQEKLIINDKVEYYNDDSYPMAFKTDILRYEIIKKYGGVYIDMDTEPLKRMDENMFNLSFFAGIQNNREINNAIFASEINGDLIKNVSEWLVYHLKSCFKNNVLKLEVHRLTGPEYFTSICKHYFDKNDYLFLDPIYFYPYWFLEKERRFEDFRTTCPESYSVHHWLHSWGIKI